MKRKIYAKRECIHLSNSNIRKCPNCSKEMKYSTIYSCIYAERDKKVCQACANKGKNLGKTNESSRIRMILNNPTKRPEVSKKIRLSHINRINKNLKIGAQIIPNFNPLACTLIDNFGKEHKYNFQHAMNGGEYYIKELGYWVDGYDRDENVVIEIDERKHFKNGLLNQHDIQRQSEIQNFLKCKFIRLKIFDQGVMHA